MREVDLQSTSLKTACYQEQSAFFDLEFQSGMIYRYLGVPVEVYQELLQAESKGRYFNLHIRNRYSYTKSPLLNASAPNLTPS